MNPPNDSDVEIHHLNLHTNQERNQDLVFTVFGAISSVDPTTNKVKVIFPDRTNDNQTYMESNWIPLCTPVAGNQFGIQFLPYGGATVNDPDGKKQQGVRVAEQCIVYVIGRKRGQYAVGAQIFNTSDVPPTGYQDKSGVQAQAGEWLLKHASGSYVYLSNTDNITKLIALTNPAPILLKDDAPDDCNANIVISAAAYGQNTNKNGNNVGTGTSTVEIVADSSGASDSTTSNLLLSAINPDAENNAENTTNVALNSNVTKGAVGTANLDLIASSNGAQTDTAEFTLEASAHNQATATGTINIDATNMGTAGLNITVTGKNSTANITVSGQTNEMNVNVDNGTVNVTSNTTNVMSDSVNLGTGTMKRLLNDVTAQLLNSHTHSGVQTGSSTSGPMVQQITSDDECQNAYGS